jgi:hypothetical protein
MLLFSVPLRAVQRTKKMPAIPHGATKSHQCTKIALIAGTAARRQILPSRFIAQWPPASKPPALHIFHATRLVASTMPDELIILDIE